MGAIATFIDGGDKNAIVSNSFYTSFLDSYAAFQRQFQSLLPAIINVIGQCMDSGNQPGVSALMDMYETLLVLVISSMSLLDHKFDSGDL
jgi:hypothetical protein